MTSSPAAMIMIALAAGGVAAVGTTALMPENEPVVQAEGASTQRALEGLQDEVERLMDEQASLRGQVQDLELRLATAPIGVPAGDQPEALMADTGELVELRQQVAQLSAQVSGVGATGTDPIAIDTVSAALTQIREEEDLERERVRAEARKERESERLVELTEELTLDSYQQGKMSELIADYGASSSGIIDGARETGDWGSLRGEFGTLHDTMDESMSAFLTPAQLEQLAEMGGARALNSSGWGNWGSSRSSSSSSNGD